jgi:hypothetical protein
MKNKIILSALLGATTSLMALGGEQAYLYKDPRIMGMGGANIAVGGYSGSVFSNPAGLASIEKENGYIVDILNIGLSGSSGIGDFVNDIGDAETDEEMADVLKKYAGEHFHAGVDNYSAISHNGDSFAWSVGLLTASDVNFEAHPNGSTNGGLLETTSRVYGGVVVGAAKEYHTDAGRVDLGIGLKFITQKSYEGALGLSELVNSDDIAQTLQDKYEKDSSGVGLDLGLTYHPFENSLWHPAIGLSVLNIGDMGMDDNYGQQPTTVNIGFSLTPEVSFLHKVVFALDYVDIFNENIIRIYDYNADGEVVRYSDYTDSDALKRLRIGAGFGLVDTSWFSAQINTGLYQGAYTAGLDMSLSILKINVATYEEQVGTGSVDIPDRRYIALVSIGW